MIPQLDHEDLLTTICATGQIALIRFEFCEEGTQLEYHIGRLDGFGGEMVTLANPRWGSWFSLPSRFVKDMAVLYLWPYYQTIPEGVKLDLDHSILDRDIVFDAVWMRR